MVLAQNIAYYRDKTKMTQQGLADKLNVSHHTVSKWECGINNPSVEDLQALAAALHVSVGNLLEDRSEPKIKDFRAFLTIGQTLPEKGLSRFIENAYGQIFEAQRYAPNSEEKVNYILAWMAYCLWRVRSVPQKCRSEYIKFSVEGFTTSMFIYNPDSLTEAYKCVPIECFATLFYNDFKFIRDHKCQAPA